MEKTHKGWIKLHRKFLDWRWYSSPEAKAVFIDCLLRAATIPKMERGIRLQRGQLITTIAELAERNGLSIQQTKTQTKRLKSTNEITIKTTNKFTIITICNYDSYQLSFADAQQTNQQTNQQTESKKTTNKVTNANIVLEEDREEDREEYTHTGINNRGGCRGRRSAKRDSMLPDAIAYNYENLRQFIENAPCAQRVRDMPFQLSFNGFRWLVKQHPAATIDDFVRTITEMGNYKGLEKKMSVVQTMHAFLSVSTFCRPKERATGLQERSKRTININELIPHEKH